jgi:CRP-like cAMP-binding protein
MVMRAADEHRSIENQLAAIPLLASLDAHERAALTEAATVEVPAGTAIIREGSTTTDFYILLAGSATVTVSVDGSPVEVGSIQPGDTLGEIAALLDEPRTAAVVAARPCRLLRLDAGSLESLFADNPRFGAALSRELARRLKDELATKNELQLDHLPETVVLQAPDINRARQHMVAYYAAALRHLLVRQRLVVGHRFPLYETSLVLSADELASWLTLFGSSDPDTPFTHHAAAASMALLRAAGDVGVHPSNLTHVRCEMATAAGHPIRPDRRYRLSVQIEDLVVLDDARVGLVCASRLHDQSAFRVRSYRDFFEVLNLEKAYIEALRAARGNGRVDAAAFHGRADRQAELGAVRRVPIDVPDDMGRRFGRISGDFNLVHTTPLAAKMLGYPRPFIQTLCTANLVVRHLMPADAPPECLRIAFARPVFVGQRIELRYGTRQFELCDQGGALLAFGDFDSAASKRSV